MRHAAHTTALGERRNAGVRPVSRVRGLDILGLTVVLAVTATAWRSVLSAAQPLVSGDLFTPFTMEAFRAWFLGFWNPVIEFPNVETIDRLAFVAPFLPLGDPALIQKAMIVVLVLGAGASLYLSARRLSAPWIPAVLAAIAFACNPWIAQRLQHLYILPGYVVLPAVVALWIRPSRRASTLWLVVLLTLGSATPHTTVGLWFVLLGLLLMRPTRDALRRFTWTAGAYAAVNVGWWLPTLAYLGAADLVPSWPTWDLVTTFSRHAEVAAVLRLDGYWWPLADVDMAGWQVVAGLGLAGAAVVAVLAGASRWRWALAVPAALLGALALGTNAAVGYHWLAIEGPWADRVGWLLRDPNKLVGALAGLLALLAAGAAGFGAPEAGGDDGSGGASDARSADRAARREGTLDVLDHGFQAILLAGYLAFSLPYTTTYVAAAYEANPVPDGLRRAADWLGDQPGRAAWIPAYLGAQTFWNGDNLSPEFLAFGTPGPVLAPYNYDDRARRSFFALDFGAVLGDLSADPSTLMDRFGVRWLAHHRDVLPARLQSVPGWDPRVELRALQLSIADLPEAATFSGVTVYGSGDSLGPRWVVPAFAPRPTATAAVLSVWGRDARDLVAVGEDHPGIGRVLLVPGDALVPALADDALRIPLAEAAPYASPAERWSRLSEADLAWWPALAARGGPAPPGAPGVVTTRAAGASLTTAVDAPAGRYAVWSRVYRGPDAGRVLVALGDKTWTVDLRRPTTTMAWERLGSVEVPGGTTRVTLDNVRGENAIADLILVPEREEGRATARANALEHGWLWTQTDACRTRSTADRFVDRVAIDAPLPWDEPLATGRPWRAYDLVELDVLGHGDGRVVEAWTQVDGVWIQLGEVEAHWTGWHTTWIPVDPDRFVFAPSGARAEATLLRLLASSPRPDPDGAPISVRNVTLRSHAPCTWSVDASESGTYVLEASAASREFPVEVGNATYVVDDGVASDLRLQTGTNALRFPEGVPADVRGLWLRAEDAGGQDVATAPQTCPDTWRLVWTADRYIERLTGTVDGERIAAVPVDGLLAGYWLPPGTCGPVYPGNPWKRLGAASLAASVVAMLGLVALAAMGRVP